MYADGSAGCQRSANSIGQTKASEKRANNVDQQSRQSYRYRISPLELSASLMPSSPRVDCAFVDRADIVQYVDLPSREAIYEILRTCVCEIMQKGILSLTVSLDRRALR
jgi:hypothetical protein